MATCASVRRKGSTDQCLCRALVGHTLCGVHARCKVVTLWADVNQEKVHAARRIQAVVRGWIVRHRLALAGPGVLRRTGLANEEDLVTCESVARQDPLSYVAFQEGDKLWWFDFASLWTWTRMSVTPLNPYTKVPLTSDTRRRLCRLWSYKRRHGEVLPLEPASLVDRLRIRWTVLCQVFADCGFGTLTPDPFLELTKHDYILLCRILRDEIQAILPRERHALALIHRCLITAWTLHPAQYKLQCSFALMAMLLHSKRPTPLAGCILSAIYRL